jgi:hypothetical protein
MADVEVCVDGVDVVVEAEAEVVANSDSQDDQRRPPLQLPQDNSSLLRTVPSDDSQDRLEMGSSSSSVMYIDSIAASAGVPSTTMSVGAYAHSHRDSFTTQQTMEDVQSETHTEHTDAHTDTHTDTHISEYTHTTAATRDNDSYDIMSVTSTNTNYTSYTVASAYNRTVLFPHQETEDEEHSTSNNHPPYPHASGGDRRANSDDNDNNNSSHSQARIRTDTNPYFCFICYEDYDTACQLDDGTGTGEVGSSGAGGHRSMILSSCGHKFCVECLQSFVGNCVADGKVTPKCFHPATSTQDVPNTDGSGSGAAGAVPPNGDTEKSTTDINVSNDLQLLQDSNLNSNNDTNPDVLSNPNSNLPPVAAHLIKTCDQPLADADIELLVAHDDKLKSKFTRFKFMQSNQHARECPYDTCGELQIGDPANPAIICRRSVLFNLTTYMILYW